MTPRERDTLETIVRDVAEFNGHQGRMRATPNLRRLEMIRRCSPNTVNFAVFWGDIVIDGVTFRATGAQCA